jgi:hypothetical protein
VRVGLYVRLICFEEQILLICFIFFLYYSLPFEKCHTGIPFDNKSCLIFDDLNEKTNPYLCFYVEIGTQKERLCVSACPDDLFEVCKVFLHILFFCIVFLVF